MNTSLRLKARAGFSLAELVIALTLTAVVGAAVTTLFVTQNRFFDAQAKLGNAREVSRAALGTILADLRMVEQQQGVVSASDSVLVLRVPFAMGIICSATAASITAMMLPIADEIAGDRLLSYRGYMFRSLWSPTNNGQYTYVNATPSGVAAGNAATCTGNGINPAVVPNSRLVTLTPGHAGAQRRWPIMMWGQITYRFTPLASGGRGLFRQAAGQINEELVGPFANTASFRFLTGALNDPSQAAPPTPLSNLNGIELVLDGLSERPNADGSYSAVPFRTSVYFQNRVN